jgi:signal transduction histidine kinase
VRVAARGRVLDALLALVLLAGAEAAAVAGGGPPAAPLPVRVVLAAAAVIPLAWRRRAPVTVWAVSGAAVIAAIVSRGSPGAAVLAPLIALYTVAATSRRRVSAAAGVVTLAGFTAAALTGPRSSFVVAGSTVRAGGPLLLAAVVIACWLTGDNVRVRRAYVAELRAKAQRAEADRQAEADRAAAAERARIARDLHDVIAHHVSVIAVQAGAARLLAETGASATEAGPTWSGVEGTARQALAELRQLLGVLRRDGNPPARAPQPGLAQLGQLLDQARRGGLPVQVRTEGSPHTLPPAADLCAYRVIQEALTNVRKHQGRAATSVALRYLTGRLEIEVTSQAGPQPPPLRPGGTGHGLAGMRERVTLLGGELTAGPAPDGGFAVTARIPLPEAPA